jgi:PadR family transcriptional regulator, regulatory protein PadR
MMRVGLDGGGHYKVLAPTEGYLGARLQELPVLASGDGATDACRCDGGQPKNFARPCLLLLLAESPAHGYELLDRLRPFGFEITDPASIYKTLRQMEQDGLVTSQWELSSRGPARRVYCLSSDGRDLLEAWALTLEQNRAILTTYLKRYRELEPSPRLSTAGVQS